MADFPTAPKRTEICDSCGKPITIEVGITYVGSTDGRFWHYGCARENTRPAVPSLGDDEMDKLRARIAKLEEALRKIESYYDHDGCNPPDVSQMAGIARAAIAAMTG